MKRFHTMIALVIAALNVDLAVADDWPQWMGPGRDSIWSEEGVVKTLPKGEPKILWRTPIHLGYGGPAVVGDRVYVMDYVLKKGKVANDPGTAIATHLVRHGIKAEADHTYSKIPASETALFGSRSLKVGDLLLSAAADMGADLLVMGGYSHSRTREMMTGGVTRSILQHMTVPVLMSH